MRVLIYKGKVAILPRHIDIIELKPQAVTEIISRAKNHISGDHGGITWVDVIRLVDGGEFIITTRRIYKAVYWTLATWDKTIVAGGVFLDRGTHGQAEYAAALPRIRGRGVYTTVLMYMRKRLEKPLISDRMVSIATIRSWLKAGAVTDHEHGVYRINPVERQRFRCLLALETVNKK